jgi:glycosyltransferase involved in cell wall biosynthesis
MIRPALETAGPLEMAHHEAPQRRVSVVLITQDEEVAMTRAIQSCRAFADEIVVVDGGSRDGSVARARAMNCTVYENRWPGFAEQRNFGIEHARHDWIFLIDSDEVVSPALAEAIIDWKSDRAPTADAFVLTRRTDLLGSWMAADPQVRLHHRRLRFRDDLVHEKLDLSSARLSRLNGTLWHYGFRSVADMVRRYNEYTDLEAEQATRHRAFRLSRMVLRPIGRFVRNYFLRGLIRKGVPGLTKAALLSYNEFLAEAKVWERDWRGEGSPHDGMTE